MIGILDIGMGNLRSMANAIDLGGFDPLVVAEASAFDDLTHLVIPGVGHFGAAMSEISVRNLSQGIRDFADSGRPLLGVCLGMHLLAAMGEEGGLSEGLGFISGTVRRLEPGPGMRVPHVGWNELEIRRNHPVFEGIKANRDFYYVHSFAMFCESDESVLGTTDYGGSVTAVVGHGNVLGFQFHPEKSQTNGLKLIENFCLWDGRC